MCVYISFIPWQELEDNEKLICEVYRFVYMYVYIYTHMYLGKRLEDNEKHDIIEKNFSVQ